MQKISSCLWFDNQAEEAVKFYTSIFKDSKVLDTLLYTEAGPGRAGSVLTVTFELNGHEFIALNGGPHYKFTPAISLFVKCESQAEVDYYWEKLLVGGEPNQCGWLTDKFGVSWQVVPTVLHELIHDKDRVKANRVVQAMFKMAKLDIKTLKAAYDNP